MTRVDVLAAHLRGEHREKADDECEACSRSARPESATPSPKKGEKRAQTARSGKCEHCGAPTGGRFAPGHDAKLKSELARAAAGGDAEAVAELILRDWWRLTKTPIPPAAVKRGSAIAEADTGELVPLRNLARQRQT